jgi:hypothetical protein
MHIAAGTAAACTLIGAILVIEAFRARHDAPPAPAPVLETAASHG